MHRPSSEPLEARILPDPPSARSGAWKNWALAFGAFALFVACSGGLFWALGQLVNLGFNDGAAKGSLVYSWEAPEEQAANVAAAMNAKSPGCNAVELRELTRFFTRVMDALAQEEHVSFRDLVDHNAFAHRASLHPVAVASGDFDQGEVEAQLEYDLEGPRDWSRFSIVHVARGAAANEALVYVVFSGDNQNPTPFRWWLRRSGRNWTICDWEMIDLGHSEAARWARTRSITDDPLDAQYWQATAALQRATDESAAGRRGAAAAQVKDAESKRLPAEVADMTHVEAAIAWLHCGRPDLALAACDRVSRLDRDVGAVYIRARALWDLERQDDFLAEVAKYRTLAGCHPELLRSEAEALETLGKRAEAAECWWEVVRLMPDDRDALFEFCRLADDARRAELKQILAKSKKPVDQAAEMAIEAIQRDEVAAAEALVGYVHSAEPNSATIERLTALQHDYDEEYEQAAEHYLNAYRLESHIEQKREHFHRYLASMAAAGRAAEAYEAAEDHAAAFEFLTAGHEYDESHVDDEALSKLLAAHRPRQPDNARVLYLSAKLLLNQGDYAAAAAEFLKAEAVADGGLSGLIRTGRLEAIYRQGSIKKAYEAYSEARAEVFRELAWLANASGHDEGLGELIGLHARRMSGDPWIGYFTALREQAAGNYTAALAALVPAESADDQGLQSLCARLKTELYIKSDNTAQAYLNGGPPAEAFLRIANRLADDGDWQGVLGVAQLHAAAVPTDANSLYYATKALWQLGEHQKLIQNLTPWPTDRIKALDQAWAAEVADLHVRSWLRIKPGEEARKVAQQIQAELGLDLPLVAAELRLGNHQGVKELLSKPLVGREFFQRQLHLDPEWAPVLFDPGFAGLRRRFALERPNDYGRRSASLVVLLKHRPDDARSREAFQRAAGPPAIPIRQAVTDSGNVPRTSLLADLPGGTLILTARSDRYCDARTLPGFLPADSPLRKAVEEHTAWIAIDMILADQQQGVLELEDAGQQLAAALGAEDALAVYAYLPRGGTPRFVVADNAARSELSAGNFLKASGGSERGALYLYETESEQPDNASRAWSQRRKQLRALADQGRTEKAAGHAAIRIRWQRGHAQEDAWLNVVRSKRGYYRSEEFIAEMTADSLLWPHLRTGERVRVSYYEPLEIRPVTPPEDESDRPILQPSISP